MRRIEHAVLVTGGGPTGLMLAGELALAGVDVVIVERRPSEHFDGPRSRGLHSRTIEILDQRGIVDRFLAEGRPVQIQRFAGNPLDISDFPTRHNYGLALMQKDFERLLGAWTSELAVPIVREREVTGFSQDDSGVNVDLSDGRTLRTAYLVGCDGGRSVIRKAAGIEFRGLDPSTSWLIAEVEMAEEPQFGMRREGGGIGRVGDAGAIQVVVIEIPGRTRLRAHPGRRQRGAHRCLRDGLRGTQPHLDLTLHRHDPASDVLPRRTGAACRRRGARAPSRKAARA